MRVRGVLGVVLSGLFVATSPAAALTRCEVMAHGEAWVNAGVIYSQGPWSSVCPGPMYADPWAGGAQYRPDCSGFVSAVWELPTPGHTTYSFAGGPWDDGVSYAINFWELTAGDAVNFGGNPSAGTGHIRLVGGWVTPEVLWGYEEIHCGQPARYWEESWANLAAAGYTAIRLAGIAECNAAPIGYLDGQTPDGSHVGGWVQDPDAPDQALSVHVYFGGPTGDPAAMGVVTTANGYRADLCAAIGSCAHGFDVVVPWAFRDGMPHPVYAYTFDAATGLPSVLAGSPFQLQSAPPALPAGVRRWVTNEASFAAWKFSYPWLVRESDAALATLSEGAPLPAAPVLVQADDGTPQAWVVDGTERRHVVNETSAAKWQFDLATVARWPAAQVYALKLGKPWRAEPFVAMDPRGKVYVVDDAPAPPRPDPVVDAGTPQQPDAGSGGEETDAGVKVGVDAGLPSADGGSSDLVGAPKAVGCGCTSGPGAAVWLALMTLVALRRQRVD